MPTREIPREEWVKFFDMFSKEHEGRVAIVELVGRKLGDQPESTRLSLWQLQSGSAACWEANYSAGTKHGQSVQRKGATSVARKRRATFCVRAGRGRTRRGPPLPRSSRSRIAQGLRIGLSKG